MNKLIEIMAKLRSNDGCPWDKEQDHNTLKEFMIEEVAEFFDAIENQDYEEMCGELGDILLQIVFHAQIASETKRFTINDVIKSISDKLIRRHPHVFGDTTADTSEEVIKQWDKIKKQEKIGQNRKSHIDGVPKSLPALHRAHNIQKKAAKIGFNWRNTSMILDKIEEEIKEVRQAIKSKNNKEINEEIGDLLFAVVNLSRYRNTMSEEILHSAVEKFSTRFKNMELFFKEKGVDIENVSISEMENAWEKIKHV